MRIEKYTCDRCHKDVSRNYELTEFCLYHKFSDKKCPGHETWLDEEKQREKQHCNFKDVCVTCIKEEEKIKEKIYYKFEPLLMTWFFNNMPFSEERFQEISKEILDQIRKETNIPLNVSIRTDPIIKGDE